MCLLCNKAVSFSFLAQFLRRDDTTAYVSLGVVEASDASFPSLVRRGVCAEGADGGGAEREPDRAKHQKLFKVPRSGSL